jgi:hypothetical protein
VHRITALRLEEFSIQEGAPEVHLGDARLNLPAAARPCIKLLLAGLPTKRRLGGYMQRSAWVYPGYWHGEHELPSSFAIHLRAYGVSPLIARQAATAMIITQIPPVVAASTLGVSFTTATN